MFQSEYTLGLIRSVVQPITAALPPAARELVESQIGAECFNVLLELVDPQKKPECVSLALSKSVGLAMVAMGGMVYLPQIAKMLSSRSSVGVNLASVALEGPLFAITTAYSARRGYPFSTYGDKILVTLQLFLVGFTVLALTTRFQRALTFLAANLAFAAALMRPEIVPMSWLTLAALVANFAGPITRMPQVIQNFRQGSTGQLSAATVLFRFFGSCARILTTLREVPDPLLLMGYGLGATVGGILVAQIVYYRNAPEPVVAEKKSRQPVPATAAQSRPKRQSSRVADRVASDSDTAGKATGRSPAPTTRRRA